MIKPNFDNLFVKHNWKYIGLHKYNKSQYDKIKFPQNNILYKERVP